MISKKVRELFVSLMEATHDSPTAYDIETEQYSGFFNNTVVDKYIELGALELVENDSGATIILLNNRDDFLSSFAAGVREAKNGSDQSYADYNANPFACLFSTSDAADEEDSVDPGGRSMNTKTTKNN